MSLLAYVFHDWLAINFAEINLVKDAVNILAMHELLNHRFA